MTTQDPGQVATTAAPPHSDASPIADGVGHRLDPRVIPLDRTTGWIVTGVVGSALLVVLLFNWVASGPTAAGLLVRMSLWIFVCGLLSWRAHVWPPIEYRHVSYRVDELGIEIRHGVYWRVVVNVPRSRVQHTDVSQGPLERKYGLGTLVIYTAGTDHSKVSLQGLEHSRALRIREHLLPGGTGDAV